MAKTKHKTKILVVIGVHISLVLSELGERCVFRLNNTNGTL